MKIDEDDLKKLFDTSNSSLKTEFKKESVLVKRVKSTSEIKKVQKTLRRIHHKKEKSDSTELFNSILRFLAISGFSGFLIFILLGWSGISKQIEWGYYVSYLDQNIPTASVTPTIKATATPTATVTVTQRIITFATPTPSITPKPSVTPTPASSSVINFPLNNLRISKLNISANVIWDVEESDILEQLKSGVVHYKGTSHPGEGGNVFIVGHSSNYPWIFSSYNSVFALLSKLAPGDRIELSTDKSNYIYEVVSTQIVKPSEVTVLQNASKETLSLMTCWPIGTSLKRMVVQAELINSH